MQISEKWSITGRPRDFVLTERSVKKDAKTGADKVSEKQTYHPSIEQCLYKIVTMETRNALDSDGTKMIGDIAELNAFLDELKTDLKDIANAAQVSV